MIEYLTHTAGLNLLAAAFMGLLVALNPCQIAICLSAITSTTNKDNINDLRQHTFAFALGRFTTYMLLGLLFVGGGLVIKEETIDKITDVVELLLPYFCLAFALFFLYRALHRHHHDDNCHNSKFIIRKRRKAGMFILGVVLALIFCPESALVFFGMMIPLALLSPWGFGIVLVFSVFAIIPLLLIAHLCRDSKRKADVLNDKLEKFQFYINLVSAVALIAIAIYVLII